MLVEVGECLTRHLPAVEAVLEVSEDLLAYVGVTADEEAVVVG